MSNPIETGNGEIELLNTPIGVRILVHWELTTTTWVKWVPFPINGRLHKISTTGTGTYTVGLYNIHGIDVTCGVCASITSGSFPIYQGSQDIRVWVEGMHYVKITAPILLSPPNTGKTSIWFEPVNKGLFGYWPEGVIHV